MRQLFLAAKKATRRRTKTKLCFVKQNPPTPCPPRSAVPDNQDYRLGFFTHCDQFAYGQGGDRIASDLRSALSPERHHKNRSETTMTYMKPAAASAGAI